MKYTKETKSLTFRRGPEVSQASFSLAFRSDGLNGGP